MRAPEIAQPLLPPWRGRARDHQSPAWSLRLVSAAIVMIAPMVAFWPTLQNGFLPLGFDDAIITDTEAIRGLSWNHLRAMITEFHHAHYVPLTLLSLALDHRVWALNPLGYHLTNVLLHAVTSVLVWVVLRSILPSLRSATLAALLFALHPVQLEAVSVAIQRKTVLAGALFFLAVILYQRWQRCGERRWQIAAVATFTVSGLAKPMVMTLPLILLLYDYVFVDGRLRWRDKLPYLAVSLLVGVAAVAAHAVLGAINPPHGGTPLSHALVLSRVFLEYVVALFVPLALSPVYYYARARVYEPLNFLALALVLLVCGYVGVRRRRLPWSFFCLGWFVVTLAPESNVVPLAQVRADRFLYLPMVAFCIWVAVGWERVITWVGRRWAMPVSAVAFGLTGMLGWLSATSAPIWHDDVAAWTRVAERHPWCGTAYEMLGVAHAEAGDLARAHAAWTEAVRLNPDSPDPYLHLAKLYAQLGRNRLAELEVQRFLALAPGNREGLQLLERLHPTNDS